MEPTTTLTAGTALRLGWRQTFASALEPALLIGARAAEAIAEASLGPALVLALAGQRSLGIPILRGLAVVVLVAEILAGLALAFAGSRASARLRGGEAAEDAWALRGLAYFIFGGLLGIIARAWIWISLAAAGGAFVVGISRGGGTPGALALALAITIALPLGLVVSTWTRLGLARASARGEAYLPSLFDAAGAFGRRFWAPIGIVLLTGIAGWMASNIASGAFAFVGPGFFSQGTPTFSWASAVASGTVSAFLTALGELWALLALTSLQLGEAGTLDPRLLPPPPPPPAPVVEAQPVAPTEPIVDATPVEPPPEPIVDALPVDKKDSDPER